MNLRKTVLLCAIVALSVPTAASAAAGTIGATAKTAEFNGTITEPTGMYEFASWFNDSTEVHGQNTCMQPYCDEHTLTVGPGGAELKVDATSDAYSLDLELVDPTGAATPLNHADAPVTEEHATFEAIEGNWTIRVYGTPSVDSFDYSLTATFRTPEDVANDPAPTEE